VPALSSTSIPRASDNHPRIHLTFISMLLFIPAARLIVVVTQRPVVSVYNNGAGPVPKQVASRRGVNGGNQRRPPFSPTTVAPSPNAYGWNDRARAQCSQYLGSAHLTAEYRPPMQAYGAARSEFDRAAPQGTFRAGPTACAVQADRSNIGILIQQKRN